MAKLKTCDVINISIYEEGTDNLIKRFLSNIRPFNVGEIISIRFDDEYGLSSSSDRYKIQTCEKRIIETKQHMQYSFVYYVTKL